jgi:hypothetical protein
VSGDVSESVGVATKVRVGVRDHVEEADGPGQDTVSLLDDSCVPLLERVGRDKVTVMLADMFVVGVLLGERVLSDVTVAEDVIFSVHV